MKNHICFRAVFIVFSLYCMISVSELNSVKAATKSKKTSIIYLKSNKVGQFTTKWKKRKCDGYEVRYILRYLDGYSAHFYSTVKGKTQKTIKFIDEPEELKPTIVQVRTFKKIGKKKVYSKWSEKKKIQIKKAVYKDEPEFGHLVFKKKDCKDWQYERIRVKIICEEYKTSEGYVYKRKYSFPMRYSPSPIIAYEKYTFDKVHAYLNEVMDNPEMNPSIVFPTEEGKYTNCEIYIYLGGGKQT